MIDVVASVLLVLGVGLIVDGVQWIRRATDPFTATVSWVQLPFGALLIASSVWTWLHK